MAQPITAMVSSLPKMSEDDKDSEVLWMSQMIETIRNLKDNPSTDCSVIVGETRIPIHKAVVQLNSSLLNSMSVCFDEQNEVTEIEIEPEFDDKAGLVKDIITSFYSGTIDISEGSIKEVYKFSTIYEIKWLKIHTGRLIVNYLTKSVYGCYERFTEIFSLAHFIWDTDLFESCIQVIDGDILELLMKDDDMLGKMSYRCMEILTTSSNVAFPEKDLFNLLVAWIKCKTQKCKRSFQNLFENLRYESMNKMFIIERVVTYVSENEGIFTVSFLKNIQVGMSDSSKDMCRSYRMRENALNRVQIVLDNIEASDKKKEEKVNEVNSFLIRKDIRYLPDDMKEKLSNTIWKKEDIFKGSPLSWSSFVNLINHHQTKSAADILLKYVFGNSNKSFIPKYKYNNLDWTELTDKAMICVIIESLPSTLRAIRIAIYWCLANRGTTDDGTLERITSGICYKRTGDVYNSNILLPTIKHLLPNTTELKCQHSGKCASPWTYEIKTVNEKLYKLEPFKDDVAKLTDNNGVLKLTWPRGADQAGFIFVKGRPYDPYFPVNYRTLDDELLRRVVGALKDDDEIMIIQLQL